jgi:hypothetical protein
MACGRVRPQAIVRDRLAHTPTLTKRTVTVDEWDVGLGGSGVKTARPVPPQVSSSAGGNACGTPYCVNVEVMAAPELVAPAIDATISFPALPVKPEPVPS